MDNITHSKVQMVADFHHDFAGVLHMHWIAVLKIAEPVKCNNEDCNTCDPPALKTSTAAGQHCPAATCLSPLL